MNREIYKSNYLIRDFKKENEYSGLNDSDIELALRYRNPALADAIDAHIGHREHLVGKEYFTGLPRVKFVLYDGQLEYDYFFLDLKILAGEFTNMTFKESQLRADIILYKTYSGLILKNRFHEAKPYVSIWRHPGRNDIYGAGGYGFIIN